jgi:hypothetical protein
METGGDTIVNVNSYQKLEIIWMFYWGSAWQKKVIQLPTVYTHQNV